VLHRPGGGCLVEVVGDFTTIFERYLILAMFQQAAGDEVLARSSASSLVRTRTSSPTTRVSESSTR
jgi:hypothetical protein